MNALPKTSPQSKGWSPERRAQQSAMMRARKIWTKSTGPKTAAGKARSAHNAYKHGMRCRAFTAFIKALADQQRFVRKLRDDFLLKHNERTIGGQALSPSTSLRSGWDDGLIMQKSCFLERSTYKS